ncbi:hypothetical protein GCM10010185_64290 [Saccharothrix coeruleofusca]|uniref:Uncharacterized protein n=1 Tax=Saccharothrix coeruleofusca TaxID=33919 RepID=A0A918EHG9_9PSEU|nr:hypothetical protein [Saccharothrix coeruleofusca]GGP81468.1 hypothetical protein GCM10010185_64290 [Saccharothrix coeruleofusca]
MRGGSADTIPWDLEARVAEVSRTVLPALVSTGFGVSRLTRAGARVGGEGPNR